MKKIEGCQVRDFHLSFFLQSKKKVKIHTYIPVFLYHIAVAQKFSKKKELVHSMRMYGRGKLRKKRKKSKSSEMSFPRISGCIIPLVIMVDGAELYGYILSVMEIERPKSFSGLRLV